jgi:hypothetical protein
MRLRNNVFAQYFPELDKLTIQPGKPNDVVLSIAQHCLDPQVIAAMDRKGACAGSGKSPAGRHARSTTQPDGKLRPLCVGLRRSSKTSKTLKSEWRRPRRSSRRTNAFSPFQALVQSFRPWCWLLPSVTRHGS